MLGDFMSQKKVFTLNINYFGLPMIRTIVHKIRKKLLRLTQIFWLGFGLRPKNRARLLFEFIL